ncbi:MAG: hypothetical protein EHM28_13485, partial [Spirochaetaceae bacterium]
MSVGKACIHRVLRSLVLQIAIQSLIIFFLTGCGSMSMESAAGDTVIRIDAETTYQVIRGFGVSGAWWTIETEDWPEENKQYLARLFFDRESGIGLSMYRYNFGAGGTNPDALGVGTDSGNTANDPWRTPVGLEIAPGIFNPARDKGGLWFLKAAQDAGVREIIGFVNSPPARFTRNRGVTGSTDGLSNIDPAMHHDFARYLVDLVRFMWENGYRINWLSPFNEPDIEWNPAKGQEGCSYSAQEAAMLLATVRKEIVAADLPVELTPFELCGWDRAQEYLKAINAFPEITDSLSVFSIHRYESGPSQRERVLPLFRKDFPKTELWMSEWTQLEQGRDAGMDSGLVLANMIHDDLASMNASSWQY